MIALSVHAAFEGLALGVEGDFTNTVNIVIAILIHKGAAGLSMGISLAKSFDDFAFVAKLLLIFSLATPFGVTVGIIVAQELSDTYEIVFASIAAGSFVYISCSEVIVEEF
jgi:zinc transporter 1/2/3